jgi:mannose-6-phosphate isomerase-like protein (cupin superfamily)
VTIKELDSFQALAIKGYRIIEPENVVRRVTCGNRRNIRKTGIPSEFEPPGLRSGRDAELEHFKEAYMPAVYHRDRPIIRSASGELSLSMVVNRDVGASSLSVWVTCHEPGEVVPLHTHTVEEVLTFISGEGIATLGAETIPVCADMSLVVPPGTPHGYRNTGAEPLRLVITLADPDARLGKLVEANPAPSA